MRVCVCQCVCEREGKTSNTCFEYKTKANNVSACPIKHTKTYQQLEKNGEEATTICQNDSLDKNAKRYRFFDVTDTRQTQKFLLLVGKVFPRKKERKKRNKQFI